MKDNFFDGLDELYHHAKFGEDRTTRAGCRCENVVFVTMFFRLDALALSVIAMATWLGGWLGGWLAGWVAGCLSQPVLYQDD